MKFLVDLERQDLKAQHRKERDKRICDRIKAILLYDEGWAPQRIAKVLLISDESVRNHIHEYQQSKKLCPKSGGSKEKLSSQQSLYLEEHLKQYTYLYVKDIIEYVKHAFGIIYTVPGLRDWLKRHGFSYKKPAVVPGKVSKELQEQWLIWYKTFKKNLPQDETICFLDGVHPTHNVQPAYGWIKKGERKEIPTNTGRSRINLSGSIDILTYDIIIEEDKTLNKDSTMKFFQKIEKYYSRKKKIHLICDNASYYKNKEVQKYLENSKICLHFLPPYSPNLNPIERLWKWMKERVIYNSYYESFKDFKQAIFGFFHTLNSAPFDSEFSKTLRSRVKDNFRAIKRPVANF